MTLRAIHLSLSLLDWALFYVPLFISWLWYKDTSFFHKKCEHDINNDELSWKIDFSFDFSTLISSLVSELALNIQCGLNLFFSSPVDKLQCWRKEKIIFSLIVWPRLQGHKKTLLRGNLEIWKHAATTNPLFIGTRGCFRHVEKNQRLTPRLLGNKKIYLRDNLNYVRANLIYLGHKKQYFPTN